MVRQAIVRRLAVRVDHRFGFGVPLDEPAQGPAGRVWYHRRSHVTGGAVLDPGHSHLADRPAARVAALGSVLVGFLPADERLVGFDRPGER